MNVPQMLVLAGGFGIRLKKIVFNVPKPLAPILGEPFLGYFIRNWEKQGIKKFTFLLHYNSQMILDYITNSYKKFYQNTEFSFVIEEKPLGTAGAIRNAIKKNKIIGNFLISNADTWIENSLDQILEVDFPSISVISSNNNQRYGSVKISNNQIIAFNEKIENNQLNYINAGVYHLHSNYFKEMNEGFLSIETDFFPVFLKTNLVRPVLLNTKFIDIGVPEDYLKFIELVKSRK